MTSFLYTLHFRDWPNWDIPKRIERIKREVPHLGSLPGCLKDGNFLGSPCKAGYVLGNVGDAFGQISEVGKISISAWQHGLFAVFCRAQNFERSFEWLFGAKIFDFNSSVMPMWQICTPESLFLRPWFQSILLWESWSLDWKVLNVSTCDLRRISS